MTTLNKHFVGVDGCKAGWFAFFKLDNRLSYGVFETLSLLEPIIPANALVLIDMPIGFPDIGQAFRACDKLARQYLPGRSASVFPVPCKAAVYADDYVTACQINQQNIGKRFPVQTWNIMPKIRELDTLLTELRIADKQHKRFFESHPELVFAGLAGRPMQFSKALESGQQERLALLEAYAADDFKVLQQALSQTPKKCAKPDDIIDAFVLMLAASRPQAWQFLPATPDQDRDGNARQLVFVGR